MFFVSESIEALELDKKNKRLTFSNIPEKDNEPDTECEESGNESRGPSAIVQNALLRVSIEIVLRSVGYFLCRIILTIAL